MSKVGTLTWAERTGGRLSNREALALLLSGVQAQLTTMPSRLAYGLRLSRDRMRLDIDDIPVPDTMATREAAELCAGLPDHLAAHSHRTYLWGMMLARADNDSPDPEVAWVASMTHDAGMEPAITAQEDRCFTLRSAAIAGEVANNAGWPRDRARRAADAVTMHFNMRVGADASPEARLVNAGAGLDVAGMRRWQIHPDTVAAVLARHPRLGFEDRFADLLGEHARLAPRTRCGVVCRYGGFRVLVRRSHP